eukprot:1882283-Pleurochrysis_carterae.AAC.3
MRSLTLRKSMQHCLKLRMFAQVGGRAGHGADSLGENFILPPQYWLRGQAWGVRMKHHRLREFA